MRNNHCYTYFIITGDFKTDEITKILGLTPCEKWDIGDLRRNGNSRYDFASWKYGLCEEYDWEVEKQMMKTIEDLVPKTNELKQIKEKYDVSMYLRIVPNIYTEEKMCLAPNRQIIEFCYHSETEIGIDMYVYMSD